MLAVRSAMAAMLVMPLLTAGCGSGRAPAPTHSTETSVFSLPDPKQAKVASVVFFVATECPISNGYAPEMVRIARDYAPRHVSVTFVYSDPDLSDEQVKRHAADYGLDAAGQVLFDPTHQWITKDVGATLTPEAAVIDLRKPSTKWSPVYLGRIDDLYVGFGKRRHEPTTHDLRDALDAVLAGKPVPPPRGKAIGCAIPDPRPATAQTTNAN